jgi:KDO2-lipid IV(A) lauroyltransferase
MLPEVHSAKGYQLKVFKPWKIYPTGNDASDARRMNAYLNEQICRMSEQSYWVHNRFKTRLPGEAPLY